MFHVTRRWKERCAPTDDSQNENVSSTISLTVFLDVSLDASNVLVLQMFNYGKNMQEARDMCIIFLDKEDKIRGN